MDYFEHYNFEIKAGNRYLGGSIGKKELAQAYAEEKVTGWCKWAYLQRSMGLNRDIFDPLEEAIHECLLPALFNVLVVPQDLQDLAALPVRHSGLGALKPRKEAPRNRATSKECAEYLKEAFLGL
eukprot:9591346-Ditylum_brightwellii.AAC.1